MRRFLMTLLLILVCFAPARTQEAPAGPAELAAVIDLIVARPAAGTPRPDPASLLARVRAIDAAALSFDERIDRRFAETILIGRLVTTTDGKPMGESAYTRMLREQYLLPYDAAGLWQFAQAQFDGTVRELEAMAKTIDPTKTWRQLVEEVKQEHPDPLKMIEAHQEVVDKARAHLIAKDLMSLPWPETCTVVRRVPTAGNNPYYGHFSGAASRPPLADGTLRGEWHINPYDPAWEEQRRKVHAVREDRAAPAAAAPVAQRAGHLRRWHADRTHDARGGDRADDRSQNGILPRDLERTPDPGPGIPILTRLAA